MVHRRGWTAGGPRSLGRWWRVVHMGKRRARHLWSALVITASLLADTASLLVGVTSCSGSAPVLAGGADRSALGTAEHGVAPSGSPTAVAGQAGGGQAGGGQRLTVLSASFVSAAVGWVLGTTCADQVATCRTVVMRKTVDGGRTWIPIPAPDAAPADIYQGIPPPNAVGSLVFTGGGTDWAFGPALWRTRDGGATWRRLSVPGGPVQDLTVDGGRVLAVTGRCGVDVGACSVRVYAAMAGSDDWRAVPGASGTGIASVRLASSGGVGYLLAVASGPGRPLLLAGPVNGTARWRSIPEPCGGASTGALAAAPGGKLFLGCGGEPGVGNQVKAGYLSGDGGRSWRRVASPPFGGYLGSASMSPGGTIFLSGSRMDVYVSSDDGASWQSSPGLASAAGLAGAGLPLVASAITDTEGFAVQEGVYQRQLWLTSDAGRRWTPVTVRS